VITIEKLTKRFEDRAIIDDLSVELGRVRVTAVCGPSGCGKSTLLRCIVGLERFDEGRVLVDDIVLGPRDAAARGRGGAGGKVRLAVGIVFQQYGLFAHMTAIQNVMEAPVHVRGMTPADARARAEDLLERVGLPHRRDAFPREMSGGEQQRVAIARALAMQPRALLLDEPTSALDPERKDAIVSLLQRLAADGTTMVVVTHEPSVARALADRAIVLRNGRIEADGSPDDVLPR
jgi:ABC-type polar amino acid transport system ATPase subunit